MDGARAYSSIVCWIRLVLLVSPAVLFVCCEFWLLILPHLCLIFHERCWTKQRITAREFCRQLLKIFGSGSSKSARWRPSTIPWICATLMWHRSAWLLKSGVLLLTSILSSLPSGEALWVAAARLLSAVQADQQMQQELVDFSGNRFFRLLQSALTEIDRLYLTGVQESWLIGILLCTSFSYKNVV